MELMICWTRKNQTPEVRAARFDEWNHFDFKSQQHDYEIFVLHILPPVLAGDSGHCRRGRHRALSNVLLMAYLPSGAPDRDLEVVKALRWKDGVFLLWTYENGNPRGKDDRLAAFQQKWESVIAEWPYCPKTRVLPWIFENPAVSSTDLVQSRGRNPGQTAPKIRS